MTKNTMSKEEYLTKSNEINTSLEKPKVLTDTDFITIAKERRSVRQYDAEYVMTEEEIREILDIAIQAPSSSNLQPWRFLVIQDKQTQQELLPIAHNQQQIVDASAVIAVLADIEGYKNAERIYGELVNKGIMKNEIKEPYVASIMHNYGNFSAEKALSVAMIDGGLVSMQIMLAAKAKGYDTVPMGGFDENKFVDAFNVPENFKPVMLISIGKGMKAGFEKVRLPLDTLLTWNKY
ncbi:nitroreductase family protein [Peribacillus butanolivorans]|uniref:Nitroreductase family protein n=1 Tax=Peribacillus butanolivorans TaxID=421767 RepID=A0AAX0S4P9_9BACI|nr:nitroreductase family protein [Peribacillus butanolivorans]AXN38315.1 nitroreductase family protein [Peribacillus butanolivorans]MCO0597019.1 nitroreductase family protein [Peribacillus butanolivorans]PEJ33276.1 nitroreductase family protein [Peribacillus butanolivorans]QNU03223.1 nitroreductase family protein [Peribacillus butanolivorans]